jgi:hypothetical protein
VLRRSNLKTRSRAGGPPDFRVVHPTKAAVSTAPSYLHSEDTPTCIDPHGRLPHTVERIAGSAPLNPRSEGRGGTMTQELHVYDHASGMIALLFVSPNGTVEAFDVEGFNRIGEFASVAEAAAFACADVEMPRLDS